MEIQQLTAALPDTSLLLSLNVDLKAQLDTGCLTTEPEQIIKLLATHLGILSTFRQNAAHGRRSMLRGAEYVSVALLVILNAGQCSLVSFTHRSLQEFLSAWFIAAVLQPNGQSGVHEALIESVRHDTDPFCKRIGEKLANGWFEQVCTHCVAVTE